MRNFYLIPRIQNNPDMGLKQRSSYVVSALSFKYFTGPDFIPVHMQVSLVFVRDFHLQVSLSNGALRSYY